MRNNASLEETPLHLSDPERKYKRRAENKLFRISLSSSSYPPLFGNTSSHGARQLFQRLLAVSQTHPFVSQPFTWFLGSFNPLRSFGISLPFLSSGVSLPFLHHRLIFKSHGGRISMDLSSSNLKAGRSEISIVLIIESARFAYSMGFQNSWINLQSYLKIIKL